MARYKTARYQVKPESVEKCKQILKEYLAFIKQNEPGTLFYIVVQDQADPTSFMHFGSYEDATAQEKHNNGATYYADLLWAETPTPATFIDYELVASKDG
jgi:quinol monooxygenase YgiN